MLSKEMKVQIKKHLDKYEIIDADVKLFSRYEVTKIIESIFNEACI